MLEKPKDRRHFTEAARIAAAAGRAAKRAAPDRFGEPEVFITKAGDKTFAWELRRFGGVLLQRGDVEHSNRAAAEAAGAEALKVMQQTPGLPTFEKQYKSTSQPS